MIQNPGLIDYLDNEGLKCSVCLEVYSESKQNRKPTLLDCKQHTVCMECFGNLGKIRKDCPECRKPVNYSVIPEVNSQIIKSMDSVTKLWNKLQNNAQQVQPNQSLQPPPPQQTLVPANFECLSLCEIFWQYRNVAQEMEAALPTIVETMNWKGVAHLLQSDFQTSTQEWVLLVDKPTQTTKGMACLKQIQAGQFEAHWTGIMQDRLDTYLELYKQLLAAVEGTRRNDGTDWKSISLTSYLNYDSEEKWLNALLQMLVGHDIRYQLLYLYQDWGTQAKLTVFPCAKPGHNQRKLEWDNNKGLERDTPLREWIQPQVSHYLEALGLSTIFRLWAAETNNPEQSAQDIREAFITEPHSFFIYTVGGKAKGFINFVRVAGNLNVRNCKLISESHKYADHFIQKFIEWATTKPTYAKGVSAKTVSFSARTKLPEALLYAIEKNIQNIKYDAN